MSVAAGFLHHHRGDGLIYEAQLEQAVGRFFCLAMGVWCRSNTGHEPSALLSNYKAATWGMVWPGGDLCSDRWLGQKTRPETC